jgi:hypothetical protein
MKKRSVLLLMLAGLLILAMAAPVSAADDIRVMVDGVLVDFPDQKPFINKDNRTMVPVRAPMEALKATVMWDPKTQQATINKDNRNVVFTVGSSSYTVQGAKRMMDTAAVIEGGRTAFPIRFAAEALGATVSWDGATRTVVIYSRLSDKTNVIGAADIDRFRVYKYNESVKSPLGSFASQNSDLAEFIVKECSQALGLSANQRFITDPQLIWQGSSLYHIRGILQTDNGDKTFTEQDMDYGLSIDNDRTISPTIEKLTLGEPRLTK